MDWLTFGNQLTGTDTKPVTDSPPDGTPVPPASASFSDVAARMFGSSATDSVDAVEADPSYNILGVPMTRSQLALTDAGKDFLKVQERNTTGKRGFGEAYFDYQLEDVPYIGDVISVRDILKVRDTFKKLDSGADVSDDERINAAAYWADMERRSQQGTSGMVGDILRQMPFFMAEVGTYTAIGAGGGAAVSGGPLAIPGAAIGATVGALKKGGQIAAKAVLREGAESAIRKSMTKLMAKIAGDGLKTTAFRKGFNKFIEVGTKNFVLDTGVNAAANIAQGGNVFETATSARRQLSNVITQNPESDNVARMMGLGDRYIEYLSEASGEMIGAAFAPIGQYIGKKAGSALLGKGEGQWLRKLMDATFGKADMEKAIKRAGSGSLLAAIADIKNVPLDKAYGFLKTAGYDGMLEEMGEERLGGFLRGLTGIEGDEAGLRNAFDQMMPTSEQALAEAIAFAVPSVGMAAVRRGQIAMNGGITRFENTRRQIESSIRGTTDKLFVLNDAGDKIETAKDLETRMVAFTESAKGVADNQETFENLKPQGAFGNIMSGLLHVVEGVLTGSVGSTQGPPGHLDMRLGERGIGPLGAVYTLTRDQALKNLAPEGNATPEQEAKARAAGEAAVVTAMKDDAHNIVLQRSEIQSILDKRSKDFEGKVPTDEEALAWLEAQSKGPDPFIRKVRLPGGFNSWVRSDSSIFKVGDTKPNTPEAAREWALARVGSDILGSVFTVRGSVNLSKLGGKLEDRNSNARLAAEQLSLSLDEADIDEVLANPFTPKGIEVARAKGIWLTNDDNVKRFRAAMEYDKKLISKLTTAKTFTDKDGHIFRLVPNADAPGRVRLMATDYESQLLLAGNTPLGKSLQAALAVEGADITSALTELGFTDTGAKPTSLRYLPLLTYEDTSATSLLSMFPGYGKYVTAKDPKEREREAAVAIKALGGGFNPDTKLHYIYPAAFNTSNEIYVSLARSSAYDASEDTLESNWKRTSEARSLKALKAGHLSDPAVAAIYKRGGTTSIHNLFAAIAALPKDSNEPDALDLRLLYGDPEKTGYTEGMSKLANLYFFGFDYGHGDRAYASSISKNLEKIAGLPEFADAMADYMAAQDLMDYNRKQLFHTEMFERINPELDLRATEDVKARIRSFHWKPDTSAENAKARATNVKPMPSPKSKPKSTVSPKASAEAPAKAPVEARSNVAPEKPGSVAGRSDVGDVLSPKPDETKPGISAEEQQKLGIEFVGAQVIEGQPTRHLYNIMAPGRETTLDVPMDITVQQMAKRIRDKMAEYDAAEKAKAEEKEGPLPKPVPTSPKRRRAVSKNAFGAKVEEPKVAEPKAAEPKVELVELDPISLEAMEVFADYESIGTPNIQRKFTVGYTRATAIFADLQKLNFIDASGRVIKPGDASQAPSDSKKPGFSLASAFIRDRNMRKGLLQFAADSIGAPDELYEVKTLEALAALQFPGITKRVIDLAVQADVNERSVADIENAVAEETEAESKSEGTGEQDADREASEQTRGNEFNGEERATIANAKPALMFAHAVFGRLAGSYKQNALIRLVNRYVISENDEPIKSEDAYNAWLATESDDADLELIKSLGTYLEYDAFTEVVHTIAEQKVRATGVGTITVTEGGKPALEMSDSASRANFNDIYQTLTSAIANVRSVPEADRTAFLATASSFVEHKRTGPQDAYVDAKLDALDAEGRVKAVENIRDLLVHLTGSPRTVAWFGDWIAKNTQDANTWKMFKQLYNVIAYNLTPFSARSAIVPTNPESWNKGLPNVLRRILGVSPKVDEETGARQDSPLALLWNDYAKLFGDAPTRVTAPEGGSKSTLIYRDKMDDVADVLREGGHDAEIMRVAGVVRRERTRIADSDMLDDRDTPINDNHMGSDEVKLFMEAAYNSNRNIIIVPTGDKSLVLAIEFKNLKRLGTFAQDFEQMARAYYEALGVADMKAQAVQKRSRVLSTNGPSPLANLDGGMPDHVKILVLAGKSGDGNLQVVGGFVDRLRRSIVRPAAHIWKGIVIGNDESDNAFTIIKASHTLEPATGASAAELAAAVAATGAYGYTDEGSAKAFSKGKPVTLDIGGTKVQGWEVNVPLSAMGETTNLEHTTVVEGRNLAHPNMYDTAQYPSGRQAYGAFRDYLKWAVKRAVNTFRDVPLDEIDAERERLVYALRSAGIPEGFPVISKVLRLMKRSRVRSLIRMPGYGGYHQVRPLLNALDIARGVDVNAHAASLGIFDFEKAGSRTKPTTYRANLRGPGVRTAYRIKDGVSIESARSTVLAYARAVRDNDIELDPASRGKLETLYKAVTEILVDEKGQTPRPSANFEDLITADNEFDVLAERTLPDGSRWIAGHLSLVHRVPGGALHAAVYSRYWGPAQWLQSERTGHWIPGKSNDIVLHPEVVGRGGIDFDGDMAHIRMGAVKPGPFGQRITEFIDDAYETSKLTEQLNKDVAAATEAGDTKALAALEMKRDEIRERVDSMARDYAASVIFNKQIAGFSAIPYAELTEHIDKGVFDSLYVYDKAGVRRPLKDVKKDEESTTGLPGAEVLSKPENFYFYNDLARAGSLTKGIVVAEYRRMQTLLMQGVGFTPFAITAPGGVIRAGRSKEADHTSDVLRHRLLQNLLNVVMDDLSDPTLSYLGLDKFTLPMFTTLAMGQRFATPKDVDDFVQLWIDYAHSPVVQAWRNSFAQRPYLTTAARIEWLSGDKGPVRGAATQLKMKELSALFAANGSVSAASQVHTQLYTNVDDIPAQVRIDKNMDAVNAGTMLPLEGTAGNAVLKPFMDIGAAVSQAMNGTVFSHKSGDPAVMQYKAVLKAFEDAYNSLPSRNMSSKLAERIRANFVADGLASMITPEVYSQMIERFYATPQNAVYWYHDALRQIGLQLLDTMQKAYVNNADGTGDEVNPLLEIVRLSRKALGGRLSAHTNGSIGSLDAERLQEVHDAWDNLDKWGGKDSITVNFGESEFAIPSSLIKPLVAFGLLGDVGNIHVAGPTHGLLSPTFWKQVSDLAYAQPQVDAKSFIADNTRSFVAQGTSVTTMADRVPAPLRLAPATPAGGRRLAVIGTRYTPPLARNAAGLYELAYNNAKALVKPTDTLISGGGTMADHVAVRLFNEGLVAGLWLALPTVFTPSTANFGGDSSSTDDGRAGYDVREGNKGKRAAATELNEQHVAFSEALWASVPHPAGATITDGDRLRTRREIAEASNRPGFRIIVSKDYGQKSLFARNMHVAAAATELVAMGLTPGAKPTTEGTLDTWNKTLAPKRYVQLGVARPAVKSLAEMRAAEVAAAAGKPAPAMDWRRLTDYKGIPVAYTSGMTHARLGHPLGARSTVDETGKRVIKLDPRQLELSFSNKQWSKPRVPGVIPLPVDFFKTVDEWVAHVLEHEYQHTVIPTPQGKLTDAEYAAHEMRIDDAALTMRGLPARSSFATPADELWKTRMTLAERTAYEALYAADEGNGDDDVTIPSESYDDLEASKAQLEVYKKYKSVLRPIIDDESLSLDIPEEDNVLDILRKTIQARPESYTEVVTKERAAGQLPLPGMSFSLAGASSPEKLATWVSRIATKNGRVKTASIFYNDWLGLYRDAVAKHPLDVDRQQAMLMDRYNPMWLENGIDRDAFEEFGRPEAMRMALRKFNEPRFEDENLGFAEQDARTMDQAEEERAGQPLDTSYSLGTANVDKDGNVTLRFAGTVTDKAAKLYAVGTWDLRKALQESKYTKDAIEYIVAKAPEGEKDLRKLVQDAENLLPKLEIKAINKYSSTAVDPEDTNYRYESLSVNKGQGEYKEYFIKTPFPVPGQHGGFQDPNLAGWFRVREYRDGSTRLTQEPLLDADGKMIPDGAGGILYKQTTADVTPGVLEVQEIQSELFQKNKDRDWTKVGAVDEAYFTGDLYPEEEAKILARARPYAEQQVRLLNLLAKDQTWVSVFTNAIAQWAKNQGFTKVRFPTGETAAKVEGHQVLADRLTVLQNDRDRIAISSGLGLENHAALLRNMAEHKDLTREQSIELARAKLLAKLDREISELKTQGIEKLAPIEAFYERRIASIVNRMGAVPVTDANGNTWREVQVTEAQAPTFSLSNSLATAMDRSIRNELNSSDKGPAYRARVSAYQQRYRNYMKALSMVTTVEDVIEAGKQHPEVPAMLKASVLRDAERNMPKEDAEAYRNRFLYHPAYVESRYPQGPESEARTDARKYIDDNNFGGSADSEVDHSLITEEIMMDRLVSPFLARGTPALHRALRYEANWFNKVHGRGLRWYEGVMKEWGLYSSTGKIHRIKETKEGVASTNLDTGAQIPNAGNMLRYSANPVGAARYDGQLDKDGQKHALLMHTASKMAIETLEGDTQDYKSKVMKSVVHLSLPIAEEDMLKDLVPPYIAAELLKRKAAAVASLAAKKGTMSTAGYEQLLAMALKKAGVAAYVEVRIPHPSGDKHQDTWVPKDVTWTVPVQLIEDTFRGENGFQPSEAFNQLVKAGRDPKRLSVRHLAQETSAMFDSMHAEINTHAPSIATGGTYLKYHKGYVPHQFGMGFLGLEEAAVNYALSREHKRVEAARTVSYRASLEKAFDKAGLPLPADKASDNQLRYLFELKGLPFHGRDTALKSIKSDAHKDLGIHRDLTLADIVHEINKEAMLVLARRKLAKLEGEALNAPLPGTSITDPLALTKVTGELLSTFKNREFSARTRNRSFTNFEEAYRRAGLMPNNVGLVDAFRRYVDDIGMQVRKELWINQAVLMSNPDGTPLIIPDPVEEFEGENVIKPSTWEAVFNRLSEYTGYTKDPKKSTKENLKGLIDKYFVKNPAYRLVESGHASIARYYTLVKPGGEENVMDMMAGGIGFSGGEIGNMVRQILDESWKDPWQIVDTLEHANAWMKQMAMLGSFFFPIAGVESIIAATGGKAALNLAGRNNMSVWEFRQLIRGNHPYATDLMELAESTGITFAYSSNPLDLPIHVVQKDIAKMAVEADAIVGKKAGDAVRAFGELLQGQSKFVFEDMFNSMKLWFVHNVLVEERAKAAKAGAKFSATEALERWSPAINDALGGIEATQYTWLTPTMRRMLGLSMFSWNWCTSGDTRALTKQGFKYYHELNIGDEILAYDNVSQTTRWSPLRDKFVNEEFSGDMVAVKNYNHELLFTPEHKCVVDGMRHGGRSVITAGELCNHAIPRIAPHAQFPETETVSDHIVKTVGWLVTDGHIGRRSYRSKTGTRYCRFGVISQSKPREVEIIKELGYKSYTAKKREPKRIRGKLFVSNYPPTSFYIPTKVLRHIEELGVVAGELHWEFLARLTERQLALLRDTMLLGDGTGYGRFCGKEREVTYMAMIQSLLGLPTTMWQQTDACWLARAHTNNKIYADAKHRETKHVTGTIWCPTVDTGFWVAERRGLVFLTGNSLAAWNVAGGGALTGPFLKNYMSPTSAKFVFLKNWPAMIALVLVAAPAMMQAMMYALSLAAGGDDDDEAKKMLDKAKAADSPWIWKNEPGRKLYADITPLVRHSPFYKGDPTGDRRFYIHWGKQAWEVQGWLDKPWMTFTGKLSQVARAMVEQVTGETVGLGWDLGFKGMGLMGLVMDKEGDFAGSRLGVLSQKFAPFSFLAAATNPDAFPAQFFGPVSKGISFNRATEAYTGYLKTWADGKSYRQLYKSPRIQANLQALGADILDAAERNGYDTKKVIDAARSAVLKDYYGRVYRGIETKDLKAVEDASYAIARLNGTVEGVRRSMKNRNHLYGKPSSLSEDQVKAIKESFSNPR